MRLVITFKEGRKQVWHLIELKVLSTDLKRSLAVQLTELIDEIEDCEDDAASIGSVHAIQFLDGCFRAA